MSLFLISVVVDMQQVAKRRRPALFGRRQDQEEEDHGK
jgi:hypothetical protein